MFALRDARYGKPTTGVGTSLSFVVPSPSCPFMLLPQHRMDPSLLTAHE